MKIKFLQIFFEMKLLIIPIIAFVIFLSSCENYDSESPKSLLSCADTCTTFNSDIKNLNVSFSKDSLIRKWQLIGIYNLSNCQFETEPKDAIVKIDIIVSFLSNDSINVSKSKYIGEYKLTDLGRIFISPLCYEKEYEPYWGTRFREAFTDVESYFIYNGSLYMFNSKNEKLKFSKCE